ncbi:helix-turn-helix domain-containing protein [Streptomyces sp. NPDC047525]|uniref:helix-turn-helix domain-containing protein n=1 Tax=Streptomyces sp. NPDC047525 TaxID=3155264 RepID=UPI0033F880B6
MNRTSEPWSTCPYCGTPFPLKQRGRKATFCGQACRQADYRKRERAKKSGGASATGPPRLTDLHEELRELALDGQDDMRHLVRLMAGDDVAAFELVDIANQLRERMEALTAGLIARARATGTPWQLLGRLLHMSPETARRVYHERHVEQQLARYITPATPTAPPPAEQPAAPSNDQEDTMPPAPALRSQRAANRLAPVLSQLQRVSGIPLRQLGLRVNCSASYLSRVLSGERFPTWRLTEKLGSALGADAQVLRQVWHSEHVRQNASAPEDSDLHAALRTMYALADRPAPQDLATASGGLLDSHTINALLEGSHNAEWPDVQLLVQALDGEPAYFRPLWERHQQTTTPAAPPHTDQKVNNLLVSFGSAFNDSDSRQRAKARLLARTT